MTTTHWKNLGLAAPPKCADANGYVTYSHSEARAVRNAALLGLQTPVNVSETSKIVGQAQAYRSTKDPG